MAASLEHYADILREMGRDEEAKKMETRAKAIRAKHTQENPPTNKESVQTVKGHHCRFYQGSGSPEAEAEPSCRVMKKG